MVCLSECNKISSVLFLTSNQVMEACAVVCLSECNKISSIFSLAADQVV